jgi:membrane-associated phospholipid phosphatase
MPDASGAASPADIFATALGARRRRSATALRALAWGAVVAGVAAPLVRRRLNVPAPVIIGTAALAPFGLSIATPRTRARDAGVCILQMWAYVAAYQIPDDDHEALERRVHIDYPVAIDRVLGLGELPNVRLQRAFAAPGRIRWHDKFLIWPHWLWFLVPHTTVAYLLLRDRRRFPAGAVRMYAVFDLGALVYWALPTAPPWYAAQKGRMGPASGRQRALRRMMAEYGAEFWGDAWTPLYSYFGGNPLAAMPSLHFATSVMAAHLLREAGPGLGLVAWSYAAVLGVALVYLGEHFVVDLLAGLALTEGVRRAAPCVAPAFGRVSRVVQMLEVRARG